MSSMVSILPAATNRPSLVHGVHTSLSFPPRPRPPRVRPLDPAFASALRAATLRLLDVLEPHQLLVLGAALPAPPVALLTRLRHTALGRHDEEALLPFAVSSRAEEALLFAELPFETLGSASHPVQTPWVIFTDGLQKVGVDEFIVWYGAYVPPSQ